VTQQIVSRNVRFHYGRAVAEREEGRPQPHAVLEGFSLAVRQGRDRPGRTLGRRQVDRLNLLLRFFRLEGGRILIDGQDIAA